MNEIQHARGTFCWVELTTTDAEGAKSFYTGLMGWEAEDDSIPGGGVYTMLRVGDKNVGGLYGMSEEMKGVPPNWLLYVTVESAVEAAAKAKSLGGTVVKDAFDVMDVGSMAVLQDPTGATFAVRACRLAMTACFAHHLLGLSPRRSPTLIIHGSPLV